MLGKRGKLQAGVRPPDACPGDDYRSLGTAQQLKRAIHLLRVRPGGLAHARAWVRHRLLGPGGKQVNRHRQVHGTWTPGHGLSERPAHIKRNLRSVYRLGCPLDDRPHDANLIQFLKRAPLSLRARATSADRDHRTASRERRRNTRDGVCMPRPSGDQSDCGSAMQSSPRVGGMNDGRLVTHIHDTQPALSRAEKHVIEVIADKREDLLDAM